MRKTLILFIFTLFMLNNDKVILSSLEALNIWAQKIFPILFPTFILSDLLLSSGIVNTITNFGGKFYERFFKAPRYGLYILLISFIAGTPTNAKNLKTLYDNGYISKDDVLKILSTSIFFNPLLIYKLAGLKVLITIWIANIISAFIMRNKLVCKKSAFKPLDITFNLSKSIENNINIILNILGTITIFLVFTNLFPIKNIYLKTLFSGFFEITNGLNKINLYFNKKLVKNYLAVIILSFGGLSIFTQIKSILKDTFTDIRYFYLSRLLTAIVSILLISWCA